MPDDRASAAFLAVGVVLYGLLWVAPVAAFVRPFVTDRTLRRLIFGPVCLVSGYHRWADAHDYGVEPICLDCRKLREVSEA